MIPDKQLIKTFTGALLLLILSVEVYAQKTKVITMAGQSENLEIKGVDIIEVIDGRKDKSNIGWVQTGMANKKRFAVFERPLKEELSGFIEASLIPGDGSSQIVIRVTNLQISEFTRFSSESAVAKIELELFLRENDDQNYFIKKAFGKNELRGMDVTTRHPRNIGLALAKALEVFADSSWQQQVQRQIAFSTEQLIEGVDLAQEKEIVVEADLSKVVIFQATRYNDGVHQTFEDFVNNSPSITKGYETMIKKKPKLYFIENGIKTNAIAAKKEVYGFASENKLFVKFVNSYHELAKRDDGFYFIGPHLPDNESVTRNAFLFGAIGAGIAAASTGGRGEYKIDLTTGMFEEVRYISVKEKEKN